MEEALDIESAHAIAPAASIDLVEANTDTNNNDLFTAVATAAALPGVSVVSMSWGIDEYQGEQSIDSTFTTPSGHQGVTFIAASGDQGSPGYYPAYSPNVVAAGGTTLLLKTNNSDPERDRLVRQRRGDQRVRDRAGLPGGRAVHRHADHPGRGLGRRSQHRRRGL